jgi:hypothetical protein
MLQVPQPRIHEALDSPVAVEEYGKGDTLEARDKFWEYRVTMNPRFVLRGKWFPRSLARKLRTFWDDFKAGKSPGHAAGDAAATRQVAHCHRLHRCEILGPDSLYLTNEGKVIAIVPPEQAQGALEAPRAHPVGGAASIIGRVTSGEPGRVAMRTVFGGSRIVDMLVGEQLPRIC